MSLRVQRLADLREPPVPGRHYMVPVIRDYPYCGRVDTWPVIGPLHEDADFFRFPYPHYHVDGRFLTKAQVSSITRQRSKYRPTVESILGASPLHHRGQPLPKGRPQLARRLCAAPAYGHAHQGQLAVIELNAHFSAPAAAIELADGRRLCPHRKVDLSQFPADADGLVTCPLHGLRVCVSKQDRIAA